MHYISLIDGYILTFLKYNGYAIKCFQERRKNIFKTIKADNKQTSTLLRSKTIILSLRKTSLDWEGVPDEGRVSNCCITLGKMVMLIFNSNNIKVVLKTKVKVKKIISMIIIIIVLIKIWNSLDYID